MTDETPSPDDPSIPGDSPDPDPELDPSAADGAGAPEETDPEAPQEGDPEAPEEEESGPSEQRRAQIILGVAALVILALIGWLLFFQEDEPVVQPTTTTTTTEPTTESTEYIRPALITQTATAKEGVAAIPVSATPPADWATSQPVAIWDVEPLPSSQDSLPPRDPLPRPDYPIQGRVSTDTGWEFSNPTPFGGPLTFVITESRGNWAKVMIPVRPNHTEGWIDLSQVDLAEHQYRVELDLSDRNLKAYNGTELIADTSVVVGADDTRTPTGRFFITDKEDRDPNSFYGPHVLPTNGYSEQMDIFDDGVPVIALHGTSRPDLLGQAVSNGCIRLPNDVIVQFNAELPLGTPVEIVE